MATVNDQVYRLLQVVLRENRHVVVSGQGGSGKTTAIRTLVKVFKDSVLPILTAGKSAKIVRILKKHAISVTAMTNAAARALDCGATTLHSYLGTASLEGEPPDSATIIDRISATKILIIDEAGMLSANQFMFLLRAIRRKKCPTLVMVMDPMQLPPIDNVLYAGPTSTFFEQLTMLDKKPCMFYDTAAFDELFTTCDGPSCVPFKGNLRTRGASAALDELRVGVLSDDGWAILEPLLSTPAEADFDNAVILDFKNVSVDAFNKSHMDAIDGPEIPTPIKKICQATPLLRATRIDDINKALDALARRAETFTVPTVKIGMRVMFTRNVSAKVGALNNVAGNIVGVRRMSPECFKLRGSAKKKEEWDTRHLGCLKCDESALVQWVKVEVDARTIVVPRLPLVKESAFGCEFTISGFPLRYGTAVTIHRVQSQSIGGRIVLVLGGDAPPGAAYVGVSRTTDMSNVQIVVPSDACKTREFLQEQFRANPHCLAALAYFEGESVPPVPPLPSLPPRRAEAVCTDIMRSIFDSASFV
jgi:nucleoside-triphosphatase THEP1